MRPLLSAILAPGVALCPTLGVAEPRQHGHLIYDLPATRTAGRHEAGPITLVYDGAGVPKPGDRAAFVTEAAPLSVAEDERDAITVRQPATAPCPASGGAGTPPLPSGPTA